jgi:mono/diheme cytochrome c family protein
MKIFAQRITLLFTLIVTVIAFTFSSTARSAGDQTTNTANKIDAAQLFDKNCAKCHGKDGRAKTFRGKMVGAQNLTDAKFQETITDDKIAEAIRKGPDEMPAFEKKLSPEEINALVAYVRHFKDSGQAMKH